MRSVKAFSTLAAFALIVAAVGSVLFIGRQEILLVHSVPVGNPVTQVFLEPGTQDPSQEPVVADDPAPSPRSVYAQTRIMLLTLLPVAGTTDTLLELDKITRLDPQIAGVCHALAHDLGHAALILAHGEVSQVLNDRDDVCGGGFTHGVVEQALGKSKNLVRDLLRICAPRQDGSCFHGVGHGLMFATDMKVADALDFCDRAPAEILAHRCGEGVFVQYFSVDIAGGHWNRSGAPSPTMDDALDTCGRTRSFYAANCWFYAPTVWLAERVDDYEGALDWCRSVGADLWQATCARGVGSRTIKYHPDNPLIGAAVCGAAGSFRGPCLAGMGSYWSVHWKGERPARDVCRLLGDAELARRCLLVTT